MDLDLDRTDLPSVEPPLMDLHGVSDCAEDPGQLHAVGTELKSGTGQTPPRWDFHDIVQIWLVGHRLLHAGAEQVRECNTENI